MGNQFVLLISASIFCIGAVGFLIRKNPLVMFMSIELMLNSVNFLLVGYSKILSSLDGQIFALVIMAVAAAVADKSCGFMMPSLGAWLRALPAPRQNTPSARSSGRPRSDRFQVSCGLCRY